MAATRHNGCPPEPLISQTITGAPGTLNDGQTLTVLRYGPGRADSEVVLYKFTGAGHVWPGATRSLPRLLGRPTTLADANEVMWQFFLRRSRQAKAPPPQRPPPARSNPKRTVMSRAAGSQREGREVDVRQVALEA